MRDIYCCECKTDVKARLTDGAEVYPHRRDLSDLPFWRCVTCRNFVGCHHKTKDRTRPLGVIPNSEIRRARSEIHRILDPIWKRGRMKRGQVYDHIAKRIGVKSYHTADLRDIDTAREVYRHVVEIRKSLGMTRRDL